MVSAVHMQGEHTTEQVLLLLHAYHCQRQMVNITKCECYVWRSHRVEHCDQSDNTKRSGIWNKCN